MTKNPYRKTIRIPINLKIIIWKKLKAVLKIPQTALCQNQIKLMFAVSRGNDLYIEFVFSKNVGLSLLSKVQSPPLNLALWHFATLIKVSPYLRIIRRIIKKMQDLSETFTLCRDFAWLKQESNLWPSHYECGTLTIWVIKP